MPKVFIPSPAPISRRKLSRVEYIISYKLALTIWSKPTLLLQRQLKRLSRLRHGRSMLTPHPSPLFIDNVPRHPVVHDIQSTKTSALAEYTNVIRGGANPHRWSPTVLGKRKKSPAPVSFHLSSRKTLLQLKDQPNVLQLFPSGQEEAPSKPSCNEVRVCHQQPRLQNDSSALREWIASIVFEFALRKDQRHQPRLPVCVQAVAAVAANVKRLFKIYPLHDDVVFLALWYVSHMIPDGLLDQFDLYQPDGIVLATRLFVLSYTLAIKWLADENYFLHHWAPHYQKGFSTSSAKALDKAALELFDYNLYIAPSQWIAWLHHLNEWPLSHIFAEDGVHFVAQARIHKLLFKSEAITPSSNLRPVPTSGTAVWKVHKILLENLAISIPFPEPAPWNPAEDPIIHTTGRRQPLTQSPSPWSCGFHCNAPDAHTPPLIVYDNKGEVRAELLRQAW